jgi:uncharacterized protein
MRRFASVGTVLGFVVALGIQPIRSRETPRVDSTATGSESAADAEKSAAIRRLMVLTGSAGMGDQIARPVIAQIRSLVASVIPESDKQKFEEDFSDKFRARLNGEQLVNAIVPIYGRHFSLEEIRGLIQFYESPLGRSLVKELPEITSESQSAGAQLGQRAVVDTLREMSGQYPDLKRLLPADASMHDKTTPPVPQASQN